MKRVTDSIEIKLFSRWTKKRNDGSFCTVLNGQVQLLLASSHERNGLRLHYGQMIQHTLLSERPILFFLSHIRLQMMIHMMIPSVCPRDVLERVTSF